MPRNTAKKAGRKLKKSKGRKTNLKAPGKKTLHKIKKASVKLEKATEKSVLSRDRVEKISKQVERIRINIQKGTVAEAPMKNLQRLRGSLRVFRKELINENDNLIRIRKKIKKHKNKIKKLKTGQ